MFDNCRCSSCGFRVIVPCGEEVCPICGAIGTLSWIEGEPMEIEVPARYKTVRDLSRDELDELKDAYFDQLQQTDDADTFERAEDIPDEAVYTHYEGICFVEDDFFCNQHEQEVKT